MADYTNALFLRAGGRQPELLPEKLILPNGRSRYTHSITLEEIISCGYEGPFEIPAYNPKTHKVRFNVLQGAYVVSELTPDELKKQEEYKVKTHLREIIATERFRLSDSTLTEAAKQAYYRYFGECHAVLASDGIIGWDDVPKLILPNYVTEDEYLEGYNTLVDANLDYWQYEYETNGAKLWDLHSETRETFVIPSGWNHDKANELAFLGVESYVVQ